MIERLYDIIRIFPRLIFCDPTEWKSVDIDYHDPHVKRLWRQVGEDRVAIHEIDPCDLPSDDPTALAALWHPHPWPSAMWIMENRYRMGVSYSGETKPTQPPAATVIFEAGSFYEMVEPKGWHYVQPVDGPSLSL